ncbi:MAG TPA: hypothetical protein K8W01_00200 [Methylorubrum populi]|uniref:Uncharacterized protein n=1 Tax=Methylorubrum populi TaxID=223967 RepID=A0A921DYP7_9HYPH|nr:hypothetical protein [Methylorubrum populi]
MQVCSLRKQDENFAELRVMCIAAGIALLSSVEPVSSVPDDRPPILGFDATSEGISIRLPSGGCTDKANVAVKIDGRGWIIISRKYPENCNKLAIDGTTLKYTWKELNANPLGIYHLYNPITGNADAK